MKRMRGTPRGAQAVGLLVCVPVLLLGVLPALAGQVLDGPRNSGPAGDWAAGERPARVAPGAPVRITGTTRRPVSPGTSARIRLRFVNTNLSTVTLHRVRVRIISIDAPRADATHPCLREDFRIRQLRVRTLQVPSGRANLRELGVLKRDRPRLTMINHAVNQDGCKNAGLTLGFRAKGARRP